MKRIVSQLDKRWSSVEMVGSESRYDKYFSNMQIFEKYIYISEDVGWGLAYINIFMQYILHLHKEKILELCLLRLRCFFWICLFMLSFLGHEKSHLSHTCSLDGFYFYVMFMTTYLVEYYL